MLSEGDLVASLNQSDKVRELQDKIASLRAQVSHFSKNRIFDKDTERLSLNFSLAVVLEGNKDSTFGFKYFFCKSILHYRVGCCSFTQEGHYNFKTLW